jgi:hypothetical protein
LTNPFIEGSHESEPGQGQVSALASGFRRELILGGGHLRSWLRWLRCVEAQRDRLAEQIEYSALFRGRCQLVAHLATLTRNTVSFAGQRLEKLSEMGLVVVGLGCRAWGWARVAPGLSARLLRALSTRRQPYATTSGFPHSARSIGGRRRQRTTNEDATEYGGRDCRRWCGPLAGS